MPPSINTIRAANEAQNSTVVAQAPLLVAALYHFAPLMDYKERRAGLKNFMLERGIKGTILLAPEGINGTVSGERSAINELLAELKNWPGFAPLAHKESLAETHPFQRTKVKLKRELISLGVPASPMNGTGEALSAKDWNALIANPETILLDTRNSYEVHVGTFEGAIDPNIRNFKQLPAFVQEHLAHAKEKPIATFCTGGIRCEKFTAYLREQGFKHVYQLSGGILKYLEDTPKEESRWQGECFVFDERVAVDHDLDASDSISMCQACGHALNEEDREDEAFVEGESCPYCISRE